MKKSIATICCALYSLVLTAQSLTVSPAQLAFGDVWTDFPGIMSFTIDNSGADPVNIIDINSYHADFELSDTSFTIPAGGDMEVQVTFSPKHNIPHNTELVIVPDNFSGNLAVDMTGRGIYPDTYYSVTQDLSEEALKSALTGLIDGHNSLGYSTARDSMYMIIDNERVNGVGAALNRTVTVYTGRVINGYTSRSDAQTNFNVNTEHTWPQSMFSSSEPMQSDLFHLYITDATANSVRGNLPFGNVTTADWSNGGSSKGGGFFEPRDEQKGKTARSMLYMITRYGNLGSFITVAHENTLRSWHEAHLPDLIEENRNKDIFADQGNRNPFIDHPEFTERIHAFVGFSTAPELSNLEVTTSLIDFGTVPAGETRTYDVVLVADGNQDISIADWEISHPAFSFETVDELIEQGEDGLIRLVFSPTGPGSITESLNFTSDADDNPTVAIPVTAGVTFTGLNNHESVSWTASSTPSEILVFWTGAARGYIHVNTLQGKQLGEFPVEREGLNRFSVPSTADQLLLVAWSDGSGYVGKTQLVSRVLLSR